ncbi:MAG: hypothetical protein EAZ95_12915 [Bacteroidetes bacterium]|nr:MAG: hypothetical protein EAZ95_12915 [Bacteroidota bacterium]
MEKSYIPFSVQQEIKDYLKEQMTYLYNQCVKEDETVYAVGIFGDSDMSTFALNILTHEPNEIEKWWIPEWNHELNYKTLDEAYKLNYDKLYEIIEDLIKGTRNSENFELFVQYKRDVFDICCEALKELKESNLFKKVSADLSFLVQECDNGIYGTREQSLSKILTPEQREEYKKQYKTH